MTLFTRSCHGPNGRFTLSCAGSVFGTQLMPYFVNSTSLVSKSVIRRYNRVNFKVKFNLGQSCYFDLRSNFQLDFPRSKSICFDVSGREKHDGAWIIPLSFLVLKLFAKYRRSSNCYIYFSLTRPGRVKIWPKEVNLGTIGLRTSQGFVWSSSHSYISIRGEMACASEGYIHKTSSWIRLCQVNCAVKCKCNAPKSIIKKSGKGAYALESYCRVS